MTWRLGQIHVNMDLTLALIVIASPVKGRGNLVTPDLIRGLLLSTHFLFSSHAYFEEEFCFFVPCSSDALFCASADGDFS